MKFYVAPMEGITGYIFRNALAKYFKEGIDKFYTPFLVPCEKRALSAKEKGEVLPSNNAGLNVVPQILTIDSGDFTRLKKELRELGYTEVNLNLGCPSRTVASKGRGAGALSDVNALDRLLDGIFADGDRDISVKTRIGIDDPAEFAAIMDVYRKYPIKELIVHPRTLHEQYGGKPHVDVFAREALGKFVISKEADGSASVVDEASVAGTNLVADAAFETKICYNGDICSVKDYEELVAKVANSGNADAVNSGCAVAENSGNADAVNSGLEAVMIGRGILRNPGLIREITTGVVATNEEIGAFLDELLCDYSAVFSGERPVLFKMKEIWSYLRTRYPECEKEIKKLIKCKSIAEYKVMQKVILRTYVN